ncbi:MAG: polyprenyl synthetase family protein, partial [Spirochaetes bacterium]|nr:polyprenyl synthetase family protein [Spirochaetota bacterium]
MEITIQKGISQSLKDILLPIAPYLRRVDDEIREKLKTGIPIIDDASLHIFRNGGKKIRASLIILSSGLKGNIPEDIIEVAAAAEIVHAATLVHDDIIDLSLIHISEPTRP